MSKEHLDFLVQKCSRQKNIDMPSLLTASPSSQSNAKASSHSLVTPLPGGTTSQEDDEDDGDDGGSNPKPKKATTQQPSKQALALHQKWQEAAVAMGGKDARIVVSKPKAKKLIFDMLENAFRPMNITDIHKVRSTLQTYSEDAHEPCRTCLTHSRSSFPGTEGNRAISRTQSVSR